MTYARWRKDRFDSAFVASEVAKGTSPLPSGGLQFTGDIFLGEPLILLETGVEFLVSISDVDRTRIINGALEAALRSEDYGPSVLIGEVNKATRDFVRSPEIKYVVATNLSFNHFEDISRIESPGYRLYVRRRLPRHLARARQEATQRTRQRMGDVYPEDTPFQEYAAAWIHVRGRSPYEAMDRAVEALDLRRGVWNYLFNRGIGPTYPPPWRGPVNKVLGGPLYSLHRVGGALAIGLDWIDPAYTGPQLSRKFQERWPEILEEEKKVYVLLKRSPYRSTLEDALRRYCRALDLVDLSRAFLELWGLLETLTGISPQDRHDTVVKRATFIWADTERETHEQVLHHLRRYRNSYVHAGEGSARTGAYLHQLRLYVEQMLYFHLHNSRYFSSMNRVARFLSLPFDARDLQRSIEEREREARKATEAARLAREGLRFRMGE
jgi:hypothetical protein